MNMLTVQRPASISSFQYRGIKQDDLKITWILQGMFQLDLQVMAIKNKTSITLLVDGFLLSCYCYRKSNLVLNSFMRQVKGNGKVDPSIQIDMHEFSTPKSICCVELNHTKQERLPAEKSIAQGLCSVKEKQRKTWLLIHIKFLMGKSLSNIRICH